jgi:type I restriction enzyme S subunit
MGIVRFAQIARECRETNKSGIEGKPIVGLEHIEPYDLLLNKWDIDVETTFTKVFHKGQILFGRRRAYLHKACVATCDGICSGDITVIEPIEGEIDPRFFPFIIQNDDFFDYAIKGSNGALSPRVKWEHMASFQLNLPSIEKQRLLAEKLWAAYEVKQSYMRMIEAIDEITRAKFVEMQENSIIKNKLGDFIERYAPLRCGTKELPILSVTKEKAIVFQNERFGASVVSQDKSSYLVVPRGYLVQGIHIDESNFGIQNIVEEGIVSPAYKIWRFKNDNVIPELLEYYLRSQMAIKYFKSKFLGATVKRRQVIRKDDFLTMPVNFPTIDVQRIVFQLFQQADKSKSELHKSIVAIDKVIKSLINEKL